MPRSRPVLISFSGSRLHTLIAPSIFFLMNYPYDPAFSSKACAREHAKEKKSLLETDTYLTSGFRKSTAHF